LITEHCAITLIVSLLVQLKWLHIRGRIDIFSEALLLVTIVVAAGKLTYVVDV
jgi:hypothetical protein